MDKTIAAIIQAYGKWLIPSAVIFLAVLSSFSYLNTKPGDPVKIFGVEIVNKPFDEINIKIQHYLTRTILTNPREKINLIILDKSVISSVSSEEGELKTIQISLLKQYDKYGYTIAGEFEYEGGRKIIQGVGEIMFEDNATYFFKKNDAKNGNGWVYEIVEF